MDKTPKHKGQLSATTVAVLRKQNGTLEAVMGLDGNSKRNADIILVSGYQGEGVQRLPAIITTGQDKIWRYRSLLSFCLKFMNNVLIDITFKGDY